MAKTQDLIGLTSTIRALLDPFLDLDEDVIFTLTSDQTAITKPDPNKDGVHIHTGSRLVITIDRLYVHIIQPAAPL